MQSSAYNPMNFWKWSASTVYDTLLTQDGGAPFIQPSGATTPLGRE